MVVGLPSFSIAERGDLICVTGSLYAVGEALIYFKGGARESNQ